MSNPAHARTCGFCGLRYYTELRRCCPEGIAQDNRQGNQGMPSLSDAAKGGPGSTPGEVLEKEGRVRQEPVYQKEYQQRPSPMTQSTDPAIKKVLIVCHRPVPMRQEDPANDPHGVRCITYGEGICAESFNLVVIKDPPVSERGRQWLEEVIRHRLEPGGVWLEL